MDNMALMNFINSMVPGFGSFVFQPTQPLFGSQHLMSPFLPNAGAHMVGPGVPLQAGPIANGQFMMGGSQFTPAGFQQGPVMGFPPQQAFMPQQPQMGGFPIQAGPIQNGPFQANIPIIFRPVIIQNQVNHMPLRNQGYMVANMNASNVLNVNGMRTF